MDHWNYTFFVALNAPPHANVLVVHVAIVIAQYAIFLVPLLLAALWLWGRTDDRAGLLLAFVGAEIALGINQIAAVLWYHPRPFAVPIGRTLVEHVADSSFPSDHVTFLVSTGIGLMAWTHYRWAALIILGMAFPVAWSRIYLGIHFPFDMIGAVPVACAGLLIVAPIRSWTSEILMPCWIRPVYEAVFYVPITKGWAKR